MGFFNKYVKIVELTRDMKMSFKPEGVLAAWWNKRDGGATDNLLLAGPKGAFLRCAFYYACVYVNATEAVCFFLPVFRHTQT